MKRLALLIAALLVVAAMATQASARPRFYRPYRPFVGPRVYAPRVVARPLVRPYYYGPYYRPYYGPRLVVPGPYPYYYGPRFSVGIGY